MSTGAEIFQPITVQVADIALARRVRRRWWLALALSGAATVAFVATVVWLLATGVGIWGINIPVNWGLAIVNSIWWAGLATAGTLISALLLLVPGQQWRSALNRFAEAMTVLAVAMAGVFPILHLGRPEAVHWMLPLPSTLGVWPQFRSPLTWDVASLLAYLLVSLAFWYVGMIPDLATLRDRAGGARRRRAYNRLALGWRGSALHWARWRQAYRAAALMAVLAATLHSGGAMLFAAGPSAAWHTTGLPPYLLASGVFSGLAVVLLLTLSLRAAFGLGAVITGRHLDIMGRLLLVAGLAFLYGAATLAFGAWYSGDPRQAQFLVERAVGAHAVTTWAAMALMFVPLQALWWRRARRAPAVLAAVALAVVPGVWLDRYVLVLGGLQRDYLPSRWGEYAPTAAEWALFGGTLGAFAFLFLLFVRFLPLVAMFEIREATA